jgi:Pumilio-family RNA binding repeat
LVEQPSYPGTISCSPQRNQKNKMSHQNRPRRPSPDTVAYLRSLPLDLDATLIDIQTFLHPVIQEVVEEPPLDDTRTDDHIVTDEFPPALAAAIQAIYEIRHEIASLAGDEYGAQCLEVLCRMVIPVSNTLTRLILHGIGTHYAVHLATHRYGSHVLQTILELSSVHCWVVNDDDDDDDDHLHRTDLALHADAPTVPSMDDVPSLTSDLIVVIASSLQEVATDLVVHICGSHCLRTVLCLLGGVALTTASMATTTANNNNHLNQRRGKVKSKHKKKKKNDVDESSRNNSTLNEHRMVYLRKGSTAPTPAMIQLLHKFTESLTMVEVEQTDNVATLVVGPGQIQKWACHASAGPVITVLVLVWTYYEYASTDTKQKDILFQQQLLWEATQNTPDRHLGLPRPEPNYQIGSVTDTIVRRILCWRNELEQQTYGSDVLYGLAGEPRGSRCCETILRLAPDSVYDTLLDIGKLTETSTMQEYVRDNVSNFVVQTILQTIRTSNQAMSILDALAPSMSYILDVGNKRRWILWRIAELAVTYSECQSRVLSMITEGFSCLTNDGKGNTEVRMKLNKCIPLLLQIVPPTQYGDRVAVDIAGTRIVHHMLRFTPDLCKDTIKGLMELAPVEMELLTKDPLASRCILDELVQSSNIDHPVFSSALKRLVTKLQGTWVSIAIDRVGHHTIKKLFVALVDVSDKRLLVEELIAGKNRMNGNSMGRNVLDALEVRAYEMNGELEWSNMIKRHIAKKEWLKEILENKVDSTAETSAKRKAIECDINGQPTAQKKRVSTSLGTIMDAISIPIKPTH